jgi:hypothetical protein
LPSLSGVFFILGGEDDDITGCTLKFLIGGVLLVRPVKLLLFVDSGSGYFSVVSSRPEQLSSSILWS